MRIRRTAVILLALTLIAPAASDATAVAVAARPASPGGYAPEAGQTFLVDEDPTNWNPHAGSGLAAPAGGDAFNDTTDSVGPVLDQILDPVLPSVFEVGPGLGIGLNRAFVSSATQTSASPQTIVYQINPRAVWSDGTPVTYRDFVYNWQAQSGFHRFQDVRRAAYRAAHTDGYRQISSITERNGDPYRVKVVFKTPYHDWQSLFSLMLPAHVASTVGFDTGFTDPVNDVSAGPFMIQSYTPGVSVTLVRNQRYWGPPANLAEVTFRFVTDPRQILPTLAAGDADAASPPPAVGLKATLTGATASDPAPGGALTGFEVDDVVGARWEHLDFNQANPLLANLGVRRALMMAVDRTRLIANTVGRGDPGVKPLGSLIFRPGQTGYHDNAGVYGTGNVVGARTALQQAGLRYRGGVLTRSGKAVTLGITAPEGDPLLQAEERVLSTQLSAVGVRVVQRNTPDLPATLRSGAFDLALVSSEASPFLSLAADRYRTNNGAGLGADNWDHYSSPATDRLIFRAEAATTRAARIRGYQKLDGQLWSDAVSLPLYRAPQFLVFDKQYLNMVDSPAPGGLSWQMAKWGVAASG